jgi:exodeoxyribonuclease VII large subunit
VPPRETRLNAFLPDEEEPAPRAQPANAAPLILSVSGLVAAVNGALEDPRFANVWVRGEVSDFKAHAPSGHWYFEVKDDGAALKAVMFQTENARVKFRPEVGTDVLLRGRVRVYAAKGQFQVVVEEMRSVSERGDLAVRFEQMKKRLAAEGLFDRARKRPLPPFPRRIGLVTSLGGAALRDVMRVATGRHPGVRLLVCDARVQGAGAAAQVAEAIARLDAAGCDVLIVGRGGGSAEDLWAFNEEAVVRAIAASRVPVVSAVGHETDVTLADLAADHRAATPSNAAETVVPDAGLLLLDIGDAEDRMRGALDRLVPDLAQRVDDLAERGEGALKRALAAFGEVVAVQGARLDALSPLATLGRGYSVVRKGARVLRSVEKAPPGSDIEVALADGTLDATVTATRKREDTP